MPEGAEPVLAPGPPAGLNGLASRFVKEFRIRQALKEVDGGTSVLDLGCGLCEIVGRIPSGVGYIGVERDTWMIDRARRHHPHRLFVQADIEDPGFDPGEQSDRVLLVAVWEHLARPLDLLHRALGWTAPGGRFIVTTPAPRANHILAVGSHLHILSRQADFEHERLWDATEITEGGQAQGWRPVLTRRFLLGLNQLVVLERPR
jgi:SAM-dependent methyltransferase